MNKWFESKNIANYAKTALLQAQKKIDQVLDIKEDEIIAASNYASSIPATSTIENSEGSELKKSASNTSLASNTSQTAKNSSKSTEKKEQTDTDSFFSTFLPSLIQTPAVPSISSTASEHHQVEDTTINDEQIKFDSFINQSSLNTNTSAPLKPKKSTTSTNNKRASKSSLKSNNISIAQTANNVEKDKQNWIQNYVDSSPTQSTFLNQDQKSTLIVPSKIEQENSQTDASLTSSSLLISSSSHSSTSTTNAALILLTSSTSSSNSSSSTATNSAGFSLANNDTINEVANEESFREDLSLMSTTPTQQNLNENQYDVVSECKQQTTSEQVEIVETSLDKFEDVAIENLNNVNSFTESLDYIKIDSNNETKRDVNNAETGVNIANAQGTGSGSLSGNASSNEEGLDTCVSSDIEVLSLPSTNGDQHLINSQRNQSSLSSTYMKIKKNDMQQVEQVDEEDEEVNAENESSNKNINKPSIPNKNATIQAHANNMHSQLIANSNVMQIFHNSGTINNPTEADNNEVKKMKYLLEAREAHILKLNKQNVKLQEDNDNLKSDLEKIKIDQAENLKSQQMAGDLKRELNELRQQTAEKDKQIEGLTQEGLKLSKQELNQSNIIKKLRAKEKETDELMNSLKSDLKKTQKELTDLKEVLVQKDNDLEQLKKLEKTCIQLDKDLQRKQISLDDSEEKIKSLENTLQNTFKELAELHKLNAVKDVKINEKVNTQEQKLKQEVELALEKEKSISIKKQEALKWELESMRSDLARVEHQHSLREDMLRKEIADLQQQLRESETRNNDLTQNISNATRPLLRQIENLQLSHSNQIDLLENSERNLIERLKECQTNLCEASEKNRQNQEILIDLNQQIKSYEAQIQTLKIEKSNLNAQFQQVKQNLDIYEHEKLEKDAQDKLLLGNLHQQIESLTREKKYLQSQLEIEKTKTENDSKKFQALLNEYTKERELQQKLIQNKSQQPDDSANDEKRLNKFSMSLNDSNLSPNKLNETIFTNNLNSQRSFDFGYNSGGGGGYSNVGNAMNVLENLQSKLKLKEGEIIQLQKEIQNLERIRESMAKELVNLSNKLENMHEKLKEYPELQDKYNKLNVEYNALLQMYGEKTEENEELKMDLQDVKEMYKLQIEDLVKRSNF